MYWFEEKSTWLHPGETISQGYFGESTLCYLGQGTLSTKADTLDTNCSVVMNKFFLSLDNTNDWPRET